MGNRRDLGIELMGPAVAGRAEHVDNFRRWERANFITQGSIKDLPDLRKEHVRGRFALAAIDVLARQFCRQVEHKLLESAT